MAVPSFFIPEVECHPETFACLQLPKLRRVFLGALKEPPGRKPQLRLAKYMADLATIPPPPPSLDRATKAMKSIRLTDGNTQQGCCVVSSGEHGEGIVTANDPDSGGERLSSDAESLAEYHRIGGPGDNGLVVSEALEDWRINGLRCGGSRRKLEAWGTFNPADPVQVKTVIILFGGRLTFNVPAEYMNNAVDGAVWDRVRRYSFVGGHDVRMIDYNETGVRIATWGLIITVTWAALADSRVFDGGFFELLPDWTNADGISGSGIKLATLEADVQKIKNGELPSWEPDPVPPPPVPPVPPVPVPPQHEIVTIPPSVTSFHNWFLGTVQIPIPGGTYPITLVSSEHEALGGVGFNWFKILPDLRKLVADGMAILPDLKAALADIKTGNWSGTVADAVKIINEIGPLVADLEAVIADIRG